MFAENRCNVLNSLAGTVATKLVLAKKTAHLLLTSSDCAPNTVPHTVHVGCVDKSKRIFTEEVTIK
jgi:hypothetical protein